MNVLAITIFLAIANGRIIGEIFFLTSDKSFYHQMRSDRQKCFLLWSRELQTNHLCDQEKRRVNAEKLKINLGNIVLNIFFAVLSKKSESVKRATNLPDSYPS